MMSMMTRGSLFFAILFLIGSIFTPEVLANNNTRFYIPDPDCGCFGSYQDGWTGCRNTRDAARSYSLHRYVRCTTEFCIDSESARCKRWCGEAFDRYINQQNANYVDCRASQFQTYTNCVRNCDYGSGGGGW